MSATPAAAIAPASVLPAPVVIHSDLPREVEAFCIQKAVEALSATRFEKDQAQIVKKALEASNGGLWHVVIGNAFGLSVSHENNALILFRIGKVNVLAFQSFDDASLVRKDVAPARIAREVESKTEDDDEA